MTDMKSLDQRISNLEIALPSLSTFNLNILAILGRHLKNIDEETSKSLLKDIQGLKDIKYEGLNTEMVNGHIEAVTQMIFERHNQ